MLLEVCSDVTQGRNPSKNGKAPQNLAVDCRASRNNNVINIAASSVICQENFSVTIGKFQFYPPNIENIPDELKKLPWVAWAAVPKTDGAKPGKQPINPKNGYAGSSTNSRNWGTFAEVCIFYQKNAGQPHNFVQKMKNDSSLEEKTGFIAGIGVPLTKDDPYTWVDLDNCVAGDAVDSEAQKIVDRFGSYTEISASGKGLHICVKGCLPTNSRKKNGNFEAYSQGRFFAVTGMIFGEYKEIAENQEALDWYCAMYLSAEKPSKPELDDKALLQKMFSAKNGADTKALFDGNYSKYPSQSEADAALCQHLAFWTGKSATRIDGLFRQSKLFRQPKWDEKHYSDGKTYGQATIEKAIKNTTDVYDEQLSRKNVVTEDVLATMFVEKYGENLKYCFDSGKWYAWNTAIWQRDSRKQVVYLMREIARKESLGREPKDILMLGRKNTIQGALYFAACDPGISVTSEMWDSNSWIIGASNGVVDLRTGDYSHSKREQFITKSAAVAPASHENCPTWKRFLSEATRCDLNLQRYIQQIAGYCLTGITSEHALFFIYGPGGNGKSVFLNILLALLKDYTKTAAMASFMASKFDQHSTDMAMLQGARLVAVSETEEGRAWAESRLKSLTGGDAVTARFMRQDNFTFQPQFKLLIIGNHKPILRNVDDAIRRRVNMIPFLFKPESPDTDLEKKLRGELPGIFRWAINGCLDWQQNGLVKPQVVIDETAEYFAEQDIFSQWLDDCCVREPRAITPISDLFTSWEQYSQDRGEHTGTSKRLGENLRRLGFHGDRQYFAGKRSRCVSGIGLRSREDV